MKQFNHICTHDVFKGHQHAGFSSWFDRKKVGNFIAGNDTSQSQQAGQQGPYDDKGKHTPLPVDHYMFSGLRFTLHFVTVDVTTVGKSKYSHCCQV